MKLGSSYATHSQQTKIRQKTSAAVSIWPPFPSFHSPLREKRMIMSFDSMWMISLLLWEVSSIKCVLLFQALMLQVQRLKKYLKFSCCSSISSRTRQTLFATPAGHQLQIGCLVAESSFHQVQAEVVSVLGRMVNLAKHSNGYSQQIPSPVSKPDNPRRTDVYSFICHRFIEAKVYFGGGKCLIDWDYF